MADIAELDRRLNVAVATRNKLAADAQRIAGRKEAAEKSLADLESEIRSKNLDPNTLESSLSALIQAYETELASFEEACRKAEKDLAPYLEIK